MQTVPFEETVARKFRLERAPTLLARQEATAPIAFTRLHSAGPFLGRTMAIPPEEAFTFQVAVAPMPPGEIWLDGRHGRLPAARPGDVFIFDLAASPVANLNPPYDFLRFLISVPTLDLLAADQGLRRLGSLRTTTSGLQDPVMQGLALAMLAMLREPDAAPALFVDSIALAFHTHIVRAYGDFREGRSADGTALAPWQLRRALAFIEAHLAGNPSIADLAQECGLSVSHLGRAFRRAVGLPPHRWLMKRRLERAKELLRQGDNQLAQIALACGFVDQSHLTRCFVRHEGCGPAKWRRLRCH
jgi:AraC-like DNA-binding protein